MRSQGTITIEAVKTMDTQQQMSQVKVAFAHPQLLVHYICLLRYKGENSRRRSHLLPDSPIAQLVRAPH